MNSTVPLDDRLARLRRLRNFLTLHEEEILRALAADLQKPAKEAYASEIHLVRSEIGHALKHLGSWARPRRASLPLGLFPGKGYVLPEPLGTVLIFGAWNYPVQLLLAPLVGALAAGNRAVLEPSELAPAVSALLARRIPECFPGESVTVVEGGAEKAEALLEEKFDHIFFTGSGAVGRKVMAAAAKSLTPVTLELGGKSPCIVWKDADPALAARRILWGKTVNAGQTCVAPDYLLVHPDIRDRLVDALRETCRCFFGPDPAKSPDYGRLVNTRHFDRLAAMLKEGKILFGGEHDRETLYMAPTLLAPESVESTVMEEEIFGPILPLLSVEPISEVIRFVRERPSPLALYLFTGERDIQESVLALTSSGGVCINDTISHLIPHDLPFGGVGASGFGRYHGKAGFDTFSNLKSVLRRGFALDSRKKYPPYEIGFSAMKRMLRFLFG